MSIKTSDFETKNSPFLPDYRIFSTDVKQWFSKFLDAFKANLRKLRYTGNVLKVLKNL